MSRTFTEEELKILADPMLSAKEICLIFGVKTDKTIGRWRKQLGITVSKGSKKSKPKPYQKRTVHYECAVCSLVFEGIPSKKRKVCSRKCLGDYNKTIDRSYMQTEAYKNSKRNPNTPAYTRYARQVRKLSELNYVRYQDIINPERYPRTICGVEGGYQLDHILSIKECWNNKLSPEKAADVSNLRLITWQENLDRRKFDPILNYGN